MNKNLIGLNVRQDHWKKVFSILIPVTVQNMLSFGLNIVDTLMIGRVGTAELAAVGAANQVYGLVFMLLYGLLTGGGVYISQYWGIKDIKSIRKTLGIIYKYVFLLSVGAIIIFETFPTQIISLFLREESVVVLSVQYFRIATLSYLFMAMSFCMSFASRCIQRLRYPTWINVGALTTNAILNYILIYGKLGFPAMGVQGAAIATLIARIAEFLLMWLYIYKAPNHPFAAKISELFAYTKEYRNQVFKTAGPIVLSDGAYGASAALFFIGFGLISSVAIAAYQVVNVLGEFAQSMFYGLGNASAVMLGEKLGQGNIQGAQRDAKWFLGFGFFLASSITVVLLIITPYISTWYNFDAITTAALNPALIMSALTVSGRAFSYLFICGILRSGGDTKYTMYVDMGWTWLFGIPIMFIGVLFFNFVLWQALFMWYFAECLKAVHLYFRYKSKKWQNVMTESEYDTEQGE
ncbi:MAG: MATE family efflux transporter [Clostridia bacterium]|nr:MATE family efflux transporter [Clostridia bacterium]